MKEIRNIIHYYDRANHNEEQFALASVVQIEESSYRRIGARMLVSSNGTWVGGISGGCLEGDALKRSQIAIHKGIASTVVYDTLDDDSNEIGIGLGCNGLIKVLFTPIDPKDDTNPIEQLRTILSSSIPSIILKITDAQTVDHLGAMVIVKPDLSDLDFCGLDSTTLLEAISQTRLLRRPQIINIKDEFDQSVGVLVEYIRPETRLVLIGDNYDVLSLVKVANELGWELHVVGRRKKMTKQLFSLAQKVYEYEDLVNVPINDFTAIVLMTHDYNRDLILLPVIKKMKAPYVGLLGPKKRIIKLIEDMGPSEEEWMAKLHSPIGLDIGAETPEEIAISITSEIIATFRQRKGSFLKNRQGTIHQRS